MLAEVMTYIISMSVSKTFARKFGYEAVLQRSATRSESIVFYHVVGAGRQQPRVYSFGCCKLARAPFTALRERGNKRECFSRHRAWTHWVWSQYACISTCATLSLLRFGCITSSYPAAASLSRTAIAGEAGQALRRLSPSSPRACLKLCCAFLLCKACE